MMDCSELDAFVDGVSTVQPIGDIGEIRYLEPIRFVSFLYIFLSLKFVIFQWFCFVFGKRDVLKSLITSY